MARKVTALMLFACFLLPLCAQKKEDARLQESYNVLKEILGTPDKGIPSPLLNKSECVIVFPSVKKLALGVGGEYLPGGGAPGLGGGGGVVERDLQHGAFAGDGGAHLV